MRLAIQNRSLLSLLSLFLVSALCVLLFAVPTIAQSPAPVAPTPAPTPVKALQQQQQQIEQDRSHLHQQRNQLRSQEQSAQQQLTGLQREIKTTAAQIAQNEQKIRVATDRLKTLEAELATAETRYAAKQTATVTRLRFLQQQQGGYGWAVLLNSQNLNQFLDRRYQMGLLYQRDRTLLAALKQTADRLEQQRNAVETQKNDIALLTQTLLAQKNQSQAEAQYQQGLITRLRQDRKALEAAETQLAKDSQTLTALIQQRIAAESPNKIMLRGTGILLPPNDGALTSGFGYRMHPILGYSRFHAGLDFGSDSGSPIHAADAGVVIFAGWYGGYGQAVIIDHGKAMTTLYGHASKLYVQEGESVQRGQTIALVGSSGLSTGPHLHFEVRVSGEPVDPANYL
jgi:murein DD-endopeptidase MepM/ murein hydrolase activator NlpD